MKTEQDIERVFKSWRQAFRDIYAYKPNFDEMDKIKSLAKQGLHMEEALSHLRKAIQAYRDTNIVDEDGVTNHRWVDKAEAFLARIRKEIGNVE